VPKQHQQKCRKQEWKRRSRGTRVSTSVPVWKSHSPSGPELIVADIIEALARTMADNGDNGKRRLVQFKDGCRYGKFGKTKAYELIAQQRIRAYKMGGKTMIDLDSVDEYHASLPRVESRAS
jgi:excisionase family DNA binding protein